MANTINLADSIRGIVAGIKDADAIMLGEHKLWERPKYPVEITAENYLTICNPQHEDYDHLATVALFALYDSVTYRNDQNIDTDKLSSEAKRYVTVSKEVLNQAGMWLENEYVFNNNALYIWDWKNLIKIHYTQRIVRPHGVKFKGEFRSKQLFRLGVSGSGYNMFSAFAFNDVESVFINGIRFDASYGKPNTANVYIETSDTTLADEVKAIFKAKNMMISETEFECNEVIIYRRGWDSFNDNSFEQLVASLPTE